MRCGIERRRIHTVKRANDTIESEFRMTNSEARKNAEARMTNSDFVIRISFGFRHSGFVILLSS